MSDPTKIVYSILLISTVDQSEKISIIPSQTEQTSLSPISFTYTIPTQNLGTGEKMRVYCDRGKYINGIFHVRGGTVNEYF